ncbi:hypothetical protein Sjap_026157 [Stephania japonica]|uniref:F-box domain-containing protein n=1 Tax=Stephania japonica TaxID=461633 RepID=A0AAP0E337_9MAGN
MRGEDRLSDLPEPILHHIFSFLPTSQVFFTTYCLSKRWRDFWASHPCLFLNINCKDAEVFVGKFMSRVGGANRQDLQAFCLHWSSYSYGGLKCVKKWIAVALARNVRELDIYLGHGRSMFTVPAKVFAAASSVKAIKLESRFFGDHFMVPIPMLSSPNLKTLELIKIKLPKGDSKGEVILGCPVLETLIMKQCYYNHLQVLNLSLNRLKELEIDNTADPLVSTIGIRYCKLELHTPNLSTFVFKGVLYKECSFGNLAALIDVQLFFCQPFVEEHVKFLQGLKGARLIALKGIEDAIVQMREQMSQPTLKPVHEAQLFYSTVNGVDQKGRMRSVVSQASRSFFNVPWASSSQRPLVQPEDFARLKSDISHLWVQLQELEQQVMQVYGQATQEERQAMLKQLRVLQERHTRIEALLLQATRN